MFIALATATGLTGPVAAAPLGAPLAELGRVATGDVEPFGPVERELVDGPIADKWQRVLQAMAEEQTVITFCRTAPLACPSAGALAFLAVVNEGYEERGLARAGHVNRTINLGIRAASDLERFGVPDVWTSPLATLAAQAGDCEDYAIAKFAVLLALDVPREDLRLVLVRNRLTGEGHAVAAVRIEGRWRVLDNQRLVMAEAVPTSRWEPVFVLTTDGVRRYGAPADIVSASFRTPR